MSALLVISWPVLFAQVNKMDTTAVLSLLTLGNTHLELGGGVDKAMAYAQKADALSAGVLSFSAALFSVWNSNENDERVRYHLNALENKIDLIQTELKVIEANKDSTRLQK